MKPVLPLIALALASPAAVADPMQADRYFALRTVGAAADTPEFVVRISETARARAFSRAQKDGRPMRLASRIVQRPAAWNAAWPFYTERHALIPLDRLVSRCPSHTPATQAARVQGHARLQGSAWCPAVVVVREIRR
jgi:hypothetical protein